MKSRRITSLFLTIMMVLSMVTTAMPAHMENARQDTGLCEHHPQHTDECGFVQAQAGQPCTHVHGASCGYVEAVEGSPCGHTCTESSGCVTIQCTHTHDESCGYSEADGTGCTHECTQQSGCVVIKCTHTEHNDECGYAAAVEGVACAHVHGASCGYIEATPGHECDFLCAVCDCTCTEKCESEGDNPECPVCNANWESCAAQPAQDGNGEPTDPGTPGEPEPQSCTCTEKCESEGDNPECPVCATHWEDCAAQPAQDENKEPTEPGTPGEPEPQSCTCTEKCESEGDNPECPVCATHWEDCAAQPAQGEDEDKEPTDPGVPGEPGAQSCTCTEKCEDGNVNPDCPVCKANWESCAAQPAQEVLPDQTPDAFTLRLEPDKANPVWNDTVTITVTGALSGENVTSAMVEIRLTDAETALLTVSSPFTLTGTVLSFTVTKDEEFMHTLSVTSAKNASVEISSDDVTITYAPEGVNVQADIQPVPVKFAFVPPVGTQIVTEFGDVAPTFAGYLDFAGNAAAAPETAPAFSLAYSIDGGEETLLDADNLPSWLENAPEITTRAENNKWIAGVSGQLPVKIAAADGAGGSTNEQTISWTLAPKEAAGYALVRLTQDDISKYAGADEPGWYYVLPPDGYQEGMQVVVKDTMESALEKDIYWADNNDAAGSRPKDMSGNYVLEYAMDGESKYTKLTEQNMAALGFTALPDAKTQNLGGGVWQLSVSAQTLPTKIVYQNELGGSSSHTVSWRLRPTDTVGGYSMVEITEENKGSYPSVTNTGTYYVLKDTFTFTLKLHRGDTTLGSGLGQALYNQFYFTAEYTGGTRYFQLNDMEGNISYSIPDGQDPDLPGSIYVTVKNLWRYNVDNSRMIYSIAEGVVENGQVVSGPDGKMDLGALPDGDYFAVGYDNSASPGYGSVLDSVHNGGTINLTLTGVTEYTAYKDWLDDGETQRPTAEMHLWRYREGKSYTTASAVRDSNGKFAVVTLPEGEDRYTVDFSDLPKYDPEGYRYVYVVREYLEGANAGSYEKVFGKITETEDGGVTVTDTVEGKEDTSGQLRPAGNTYLYDGGTLSNRKIGTVPVSVTKVWKAASFQSEFANVTVRLSLQSRPKGSDAKWRDTGYTCDMSDFYAENLTDSYTGYYPAYDQMGRPLEYRCVEEEVHQQNTRARSVVEVLEREFTLTQAGREVTYKSRSEITIDENGNSHTLITNSIANTIYYQVTKKFEGIVPFPCDFALYRSVSGGPLEKYVEFTINGETDTRTESSSDGAQLTITEGPAWVVKVDGLPEFDAEGRKYEYVLLESEGQLPNITTQMNGFNYESTVVNAPGDGNVIFVRKEWVDDSDTQHRLPVTIGVYAKAGNSKITEVTLGADGTGWYALAGIGAYKPDEVYILETKVGDTKVGTPDNPTEPYNDSRVEYQTDFHVYEVSYSTGEYEGFAAFTATNRRLGNIDITVKKNWTDGDGEKRRALQQALADNGLSLAVRLEFRTPNDAYSITRTGFKNSNGDTVSISRSQVPIRDNEGNPAASIQALNLDLDSQALYFHNLPKYDEGGASVRYTVSEIFVNRDGNEVDINDYPSVAAAYASYRLSFVEGPYNVAHLHDEDSQEFELTNGLYGVKPVRWYCLWLDNYVYNEGNRPDVYLDIYARRHVKDEHGNVITKMELYRADYKWEYHENTDTDSFWVCTLDDLPMYDELGYEIDYFATIDATVNIEEFSYLPPRYSAGKDETGGAVFGDASGADGETDRVDQTPDSGQHALQSGNTFVYIIDGAFTYEGEKLWTNLPGAYPDEDLPKVTFSLDRQAGGGEWETNVATLTVDHGDWKKLKKQGAYVFSILYEGKNTLDEKGQTTGTNPLPRFDPKGAIYTYRLNETVIFEDTDAGNDSATGIFSTTAVGKTLTNNYQLGAASLSVKKYLTTPKGQEVYPAIAMVLTRTYEKADGTVSDPETVKTLVWSARDVKAEAEAASGEGSVTLEHIFTFDNLPVYAPNGSKYNYIVTERKTNYLEGYDTWAAEDDVGSDAIKIDTNKADHVDGLTPNEDDGVDATFLNEPNGELLTINGEKAWVDLNNLFGLRPDINNGITLSVERRAGAQAGQGNSVGWRTVDPSVYTVTWKTVDADPNRWSYTIKDLPRYANNGMPYTYRITEKAQDVPPHYRILSGGSVQTDPSKVSEAGVATVSAITNTLLRQATYAKNWVYENGTALADNVLGENVQLEVGFQLQVREKEASSSGGYGAWENANAYFNEKLSPDELAGANLADYKDTASIRGKFADAKWKSGGTFDNLPAAIKHGGTVYALDYRVVETAVKVYIGDAAGAIHTQTYTANEEGDTTYYTVKPADLFAPGSQPSAQKAHTNYLSCVELTVIKTWRDGSNMTGVRPGAEGKWSVSFLIQRSLNGGEWESTGIVRTLTGTDANNTKSLTQTLPAYTVSENGLATCAYRAVELKPDADLTNITDEDIVQDDGAFNDDYRTEYDWTDNTSHATNTLTGRMTVAKAVPGFMDDPEAEFAFRLTLANTGVSGQYGDVTFTNGVAEFALKKGQSVKISGLPLTQETGYTLTETQTHGAKLVFSSEVAVQGDGHTENKASETISGALDADSVISVLFTNVFEDKISIPVAKIWYEPDGLAGGRPEEITVELLAGNADTGKTLTLNEENGWYGVFENLDKYDAQTGERIVYTIKEANVPDTYQSSVTGNADAGFTITNRHTALLNKISIPVVKVWEDDANRDGVRPEEITVKLLADYADTGKAITLNEENGWSGSFTDLDEYRDDHKIIYTIEEISAGEYLVGITGDAQSGFIITNRYDPETVNISGGKTWDDWNDRDGKRPDSITIRLLANGNPVASRTVTARDGWRWSFTGLPKYENGVLIRYSIAEDPVPNYTAQVNGYNVTNRYDAVAVEIRGEKYVDGENAPDSEFVFVLTPMAADNPMPAGQSGEAIATISGSGEFRFGPISFTKPGVYQYTVSERLGDAPGYTYDAAIYTVNVEVSRDGQALKAVVTYMKDGAQAHGLRFTNRYATGSLTVSKTVKGQGASASKLFTFTVALTDAQGNALTGSYPYTGAGGAPSGVVNGGMLVVQLSHGQSIRIDGLPVGTRYSVTEAEYGAYSSEAVTPDGVITTDGAHAQFVNTRNYSGEVPKTGYGETRSRYVVAGLALLAALLAALARRKLKDN